ncbi:MAG: MotA/TolQ/ExbB proton channel family protein [Kiritimatiellae bacterium]|nr:MotA/TolQ/ExbB proton channel family protein [Kiritimatiellia bacterium]
MSLIWEGGLLFWIIVAMTGVAVIVFIERLLYLRRVTLDPRDFLPGVFNVLDKGNIKEALENCDEAAGPLPTLVAEAIVYRASDPANLREVLATRAHAELSRLERRSMLLSLLAQLLPLLGLIGTFVGAYAMLSALDVQAPLVQTGAVARALAGALVNTITGLVGAAFCYAAHYILTLKADALSLDMDTCVALMLDHLDSTQCGDKA